MATGQGTLTFDFGSAPGSSVVETLNVSASGISSTSKIELYLDGTDSTATHNAYEHSILDLADISLKAIAKRANEFDARCATTLRLTGTITARFVWAD
jgi:hypothetical protein